MKTIYFLILSSIIAFVGHSQTANYWVKKGDFPGSKRERAVSFAIGNYGYMTTGVDTSELVLNDLWQYDPALDVWSQKANLLGAARRDAVGFAIAGKGYVVAGIDNDESFVGNILNDLWQYDPVTNTWVQKANYPGGSGLGIYFATGFTIDSKGYVCCGKKGPNNYSNELWEYKPSIDEWTQRASFPGGVRYQLSSFSIGYEGYVGLGATQDIFKSDFWKYSPGTNSWTQVANLPGNERGSATTFSVGGRGFVCLGSDGGLLDDLWEYKPETDTWFSRATFSGSERKNAISFTVNDRVFVATGKGFSGKKASVFEYIPHNFLGLDELEATWMLYPNPSSDVLHISNLPSSIESISLISADGKVLTAKDVQNQHEIILNVSDFCTGIYYINLYANQQRIVSSQRIIIQHS
jgi:N-acetylneuraminic acid mutarotase